MISTSIHTTEVAGPDSLSPWCVSQSKRVFDIFASCLGLAVASPIMLVTAVIVRMTSRGPILFRQIRVGLGGNYFSLLKFRTMVHGRQDPGLALTHWMDSRVTLAGRFLRKFKLDELPQLLNVIRGDMSLVGPRPDVPEYYASLNQMEQQVLLLRPGLTGAATLQFRHEEMLLSQVPQTEMRSFYLGTLLPKKIKIDLEYARQATFFTDLWFLLQTIAFISVTRTPGEQR